jgi:hypothetical protein
MHSTHGPGLPLPEPLRGEKAGTFTEHSVADRLPDIGRRMLAENDFAPDVAAALENLFGGIPTSAIEPFPGDGAPDAADWRRYVQPLEGQTWLQVPWFFAETYFYRRVLAITGYFADGPGRGADPFAYQKRAGLETTRLAIRALAERLTAWLAAGGIRPETLVRLLTLDLWGNQADLSLWPADREDRSTQLDAGRRLERILVDDAAQTAEHLIRSRGGRVDFIVDNAGFELVCDLALADALLSSGLAASVRLHLKPHPTFVSDAIPQDTHDTLGFLHADDDADTRALGARLRDHLEAGRMVLQADFFWTSPLEAWRMPPALRQELGGSALVVSKGDANYRRLLGDRHWPPTTPFADVVGYFPAPVVALRTCKSEVAVGLQPGQTEQVAAQDAEWLVNGQWGMIQFWG